LINAGIAHEHGVVAPVLKGAVMRKSATLTSGLMCVLVFAVIIGSMGSNENQDISEIGEQNSAPASEATGENELQALRQERDSLFDRLLRKQAEFENYKKRMERERSELVQSASADLMKELLNALDSFDLAIINSTGNEQSTQGFKLIYKQLLDTMGRFGLKAIDAKGQKFDPNYHQAVTTTPTDKVAENTILDELRKGYLLNGRLLRPAMVNVASKG
jgi:molecular chaperone GrpE